MTLSVYMAIMKKKFATNTIFYWEEKMIIGIDRCIEKGVYIGGGILPGIDMSINALYGNTAKLPRVKFTTPSSVLGTDTMKQIQAAIFFGYAGQIKTYH